MLTNTTSLTFEGGSLTVLDRDAYAGEALMERLKPKEKRLISFALDLGTRVSAETDGDAPPGSIDEGRERLISGPLLQGRKKTYRLTNQTDREKVIYVEHPLRKDWSFADDSAKPAIVTDRYYRFRVVLKPFQKVSVPVVERQGLMDSYHLSGLKRDQLEMFAARRYIDEATRARLEKLIDLRERVRQESEKLLGFVEEIERIEADQNACVKISKLSEDARGKDLDRSVYRQSE